MSCGLLPLIIAEPGYYEDGKFGIRIESIVEIIPALTKVKVTYM